MLGIVLLVSTLYLWVSPSNPPGFYADEAAIALNASTIAADGRDEFGARLPLFFESFRDWKSPDYVYLLAGVFVITGPSEGAARATSAALMLAAVLLLGFLSFRLTRNLVVAGAVTALAGLSPWLFEVSRLVFEVTALPLLVVLLLLAVERIAGRATWRIRDGALVGLPLVAILFSYAAGRILAPLFAACLFVFVRRERIRGLVAALAVLGSGFALIGVYAVSHPGALSARAQAVSFIGEEPWATALWHAVRNYGVDINPVWWLLHGDSNARHHVPGAPALFVPLVAAAIAGLALVLLERRRDPWWQFVLAGTLAAPIPAAVTVDRHHALRLAALPVFMAVLAVPAVERGVAAVRAGGAGALAAGAAVVLVLFVQLGLFVNTYRTEGPDRRAAFEADVEPLLASALQSPGRHLYLVHDDRFAEAHARWFATKHGLEPRVTVLAEGRVPPAGSFVFLTQTCGFRCELVGQAGNYRLERVPEH